MAQALENDAPSAHELDRVAQNKLERLLERARAARSTLPAILGTGRARPRSEGSHRLADPGERAAACGAAEFLVDGCDPAAMISEHSSGTTGTPMHVWWSRSAAVEHYAIFEARWRMWNGVTRHDRWAMLGGQLVAPIEQSRPPFWVWNSALHQLYMSSYHLSASMTPYYLDALKRYRVQYLWGYSSSLYALAQDALALGRDDLKMAVAITNAEPLYDHQREAISRAFHCPVRETYGMSELASCASECEAGRLHLWPETGFVEVLDGSAPVPVGEAGELVLTGLMNADMPLIRYRVGDRGALDDDPSPCACGARCRGLNSLKAVPTTCCSPPTAAAWDASIPCSRPTGRFAKRRLSSSAATWSCCATFRHPATPTRPAAR